MKTTPPNVPAKKSRRNGAVLGGAAAIGLCSVLLSGVAGYAGYRMAANDAQPYRQYVSPVQQQITDSYHPSSIQVLDISGIVSQLRPSVVEIMTESVTSGNSIFGQYISQGAGSGVILSQDGYIVTNNHVVEGATSIQVKTLDGQEYEARIIGLDPQTDIAVIKVDAQDLTPAVVGNSDTIQVGSPAIAIGNPLGSLGGTVTTGIISAVGREITIDSETMTLIQTDAAINPGNSGGGLFNINGELIGIVSAKQADTGIEGLGFAIPISDVTSVIEELEQNGKITSRPVLNVSLQEIQDTTYFGQNRELQPGIYIVQVIEGGTADQAGLQIGDRIISFDGRKVSSVSEVKKLLREHKIGDQIEMEIERNGVSETITLTLQPDSSPQQFS